MPAKLSIADDKRLFLGMRYLALACDYDGTLASDGRVSEPTLVGAAPPSRLRRKALRDGARAEELISVFPALDLFEWVVAENGALLYQPTTRREKPLGDSPPPEFIRELKTRGVPISVGRVIVATLGTPRNDRLGSHP